MATGSNIRVGDAEREVVATQLREHYADGRLTLDELNERLDQAFAAKTRADLTAVTRDLPMRPGAMQGTPLNPWHDATSGSPGNRDYHGRQDRQGSGRGYGRSFAALAPLLTMFWLFVILGGIFAFGFGGSRPLAVVFFLAALAFLRRLFGGRRRGPRGRRCGRW